MYSLMSFKFDEIQQDFSHFKIIDWFLMISVFDECIVWWVLKFDEISQDFSHLKIIVFVDFLDEFCFWWIYSSMNFQFDEINQDFSLFKIIVFDDFFDELKFLMNL